jgi:hypothetical protein
VVVVVVAAVVGRMVAVMGVMVAVVMGLVVIVVRVAAVVVVAGLAVAAAASGTSESFEHAMYNRPRNLCYTCEITFQVSALKLFVFLWLVIRMIKSRNVRLLGHVTCSGDLSTYKNLGGKPKGKRPLWRRSMGE